MRMMGTMCEDEMMVCGDGAVTHALKDLQNQKKKKKRLQLTSRKTRCNR